MSALRVCFLTNIGHSNKVKQAPDICPDFICPPFAYFPFCSDIDVGSSVLVAWGARAELTSEVYAQLQQAVGRSEAEDGDVSVSEATSSAPAPVAASPSAAASAPDSSAAAVVDDTSLPASAYGDHIGGILGQTAYLLHPSSGEQAQATVNDYTASDDQPDDPAAGSYSVSFEDGAEDSVLAVTLWAAMNREAAAAAGGGAAAAAPSAADTSANADGSSLPSTPAAAAAGDGKPKGRKGRASKAGNAAAGDAKLPPDAITLRFHLPVQPDGPLARKRYEQLMEQYVLLQAVSKPSAASSSSSSSSAAAAASVTYAVVPTLSPWALTHPSHGPSAGVEVTVALSALSPSSSSSSSLSSGGQYTVGIREDADELECATCFKMRSVERCEAKGCGCDVCGQSSHCGAGDSGSGGLDPDRSHLLTAHMQCVAGDDGYHCAKLLHRRCTAYRRWRIDLESRDGVDTIAAHNQPPNTHAGVKGHVRPYDEEQEEEDAAIAEEAVRVEASKPPAATKSRKRAKLAAAPAVAATATSEADVEMGAAASCSSSSTALGEGSPVKPKARKAKAAGAAAMAAAAAAAGGADSDGDDDVISDSRRSSDDDDLDVEDEGDDDASSDDGKPAAGRKRKRGSGAGGGAKRGAGKSGAAAAAAAAASSAPPPVGRAVTPAEWRFLEAMDGMDGRPKARFICGGCEQLSSSVAAKREKAKEAVAKSLAAKSTKELGGGGGNAKSADKNTAMRTRLGEIPDHPVGTIFPSRATMGSSCVHNPVVAGMAGGTGTATMGVKKTKYVAR